MKLKLILILTSLVLAVTFAHAEVKLLCVSDQKLRGEQTINSCLAKGERFAVVDEYGLVKILTLEEVELTKAFNPKIFETRAFGVTYHKEAPPIPPLPVSPEQQ